MRISFDEAKMFMENIKPEEKVAILFHNDLDGFAAGILIYDYLKKKGCVVLLSVISYGGEQISGFEDCDKVVAVDLASDSFVGKALDKISSKSILIDHHPTKGEHNFKEYNIFDESYVPSSRTCYELVGGKRWLALLGTIQDRGHLYLINQEFIDNSLNQLGISFDKAFILANELSSVLCFFNNGKIEAFEPLEKLNSIEDIPSLEKYFLPIENELAFFMKDFELNKLVMDKIFFYYFEPKLKIKRVLVSIISTKYPGNVLVLASPSGDSNVISISGRGGVKGYSALDVLKSGVEGLSGANAAGHERGCGAAIKKQDLQKFKDNLIKSYQK